MAQGGSQPAFAPASSAESVPTVRAQAALGAMQLAYATRAQGGAALYRETSGDRQTAAVWGDSWALAALEDVAALPGGARYLPLVQAAADGLQAYWDPSAQPPAYAPTPQPDKDAVKYFDDNAWVGLDLVAAWRLTGQRTYLLRAQGVMRYLESGWDTAGGGLWWNDERTYRNTAANAAAADLAARLYLATGDPADLTWAERIDAWEWQALVTPDGRVDDGLDAFATQPRGGQWTYNYGEVIEADVHLFQATGQPRYLSGASTVAAYALQHLQGPAGAWPPQGRFNGVFADGLLALFQADPRPAYASALTRNADLAWSRARTPVGLFGTDWSSPPPDGEVQLLTDTGAVRTLAAAAALGQ